MLRHGLIARSASIDTTPPNTLAAQPGYFRLNGQDAALIPPAAPSAPIVLTAGTGLFMLTGEAMTTITEFVIQAGMGAFALAGQNATLTPPAAPFSMTYQSAAVSTAGTTTIDYGSLTWVANPTGRMIAMVQGDTTTPGTIVSMTVGGVAFSPVAGAQFFNGVGVDCWISNAPVPGTSGNPIVNWTAAPGWETAVGLYNSIGVPVAGTAITNGVTSGTIVNVGPASIPAGGTALFCCQPYGGATITVSANAVIDDLKPLNGSNFYFGHTTATGSQTLTVTMSGNDRVAINLVPWGP